MSVLDDIHALLPDNTTGQVSVKDVRDSFDLGLGAVKHLEISTGEIQVSHDANFTTIETNTFTNILGTTALQDGNEHVVVFVMKGGDPAITDGDPAWGYMRPNVADQTGNPVRLLSGGLGGLPNGTLKLWIDQGAFVTIKKTDSNDVASTWEVTHYSMLMVMLL